MDFYVDHSPQLVNSLVTSYLAPFQPRPREQNYQKEKVSTSSQTAFVTEQTKAVDLFATTKGSFAQTTHPMPQSVPSINPTPTLKESVHFKSEDTVVPNLSVEIDQIAKDRVKYMAVKYASGSTQSSEILARLEILNSSLSERAPLVTKEQVKALEDATDQLARIRLAREERAKRLGIAI